MSDIITAVYENGLLRPLQPLDLREHQTVRLQVLPERSLDEAEELIRMMVTAGVVTPPPGHSEIEPLPDEERRELADLLGGAPGRPLSEIIIEERGAW